jgi:hypothetical protein
VGETEQTRAVIPFQVAVQEEVEVGPHRKVSAAPLVPSAVALLAFRGLV